MPYEQKSYDDPRQEIHALADAAKELLEDWKAGKDAAEGYIPFAAETDADLLTDADMALWRRVKNNERISREEFGAYGARMDEELARIENPADRERAAASRNNFKSVISHMLMEQWGGNIMDEAEVGAAEEREAIAGREAVIEANAEKMAHPPYRPERQGS